MQRVTSVVSASGVGDLLIYGAITGLRFHGFSAAEDAGTAATATFVIRNGTGVTGAIVAACSIVADSNAQLFMEQGIPCPDGIFLDRTAGTTIVVVYMSLDN